MTPANPDLARDKHDQIVWFTHADERTLPLAHQSYSDFLDQTLRPDSAPHSKSIDSVPRRKQPSELFSNIAAAGMTRFGKPRERDRQAG